MVCFALYLSFVLPFQMQSLTLLHSLLHSLQPQLDFASKKKASSSDAPAAKKSKTSDTRPKKNLNIGRLGNGQVILASTTYGIPDWNDLTTYKDAFSNGILGAVAKPEYESRLADLDVYVMGKPGFIRAHKERNNSELLKKPQGWNNLIVIFLINKDDAALNALDHADFMGKVHKIICEAVKASDDIARDKGSISYSEEMPSYTTAMDFTGLAADGTPAFAKVDTILSDNRSRDLYCQFHSNEGDYDLARDLVLFQENNDPFQVFTEYSDLGYGKVACNDLGFPTTAMAPKYEFQFRVYSVEKYITEHSANDQTANIKMPYCIQNIINGLEIKNSVTTKTLQLARDVHTYCIAPDNIPDGYIPEDLLTSLDNLIISFDPETGNKNEPARVQQGIEAALARQQQQALQANNPANNDNQPEEQNQDDNASDDEDAAAGDNDANQPGGEEQDHNVDDAALADNNEASVGDESAETRLGEASEENSVASNNAAGASASALARAGRNVTVDGESSGRKPRRSKARRSQA